jgi:pilus assembly protein Flp/PilA
LAWEVFHRLTYKGHLLSLTTFSVSALSNGAYGGHVSKRPAEKGTPSMKSLMLHFLRDDSGATAIEYGLIAALIAVVIIGAVQLVGSNLNTTFSTIAAKV